MNIHGYTVVNFVKDYLLYTYGDLLYEFSLTKGQNYWLIQRPDGPFDKMINDIYSAYYSDWCPQNLENFQYILKMYK